MKRRYHRMTSMLLLMFILFTLSSCNTNNNRLIDLQGEVSKSENFEFITDKTEYSRRENVITYTITNISDQEVLFSKDNFELQYKTTEGWKVVAFKTDVIFYDLSVVLKQNESATQKLELKEYFNLPLSPGEYRIVKDSFVSNEFRIT